MDALADADGSRKRRIHKKSRGGCKNCKLRRVKCDEAKPTCRKCVEYGVSCTYDEQKDVDKLQLTGEASFRLEPTPATVGVQAPPTPPEEALLNLSGLPLKLHDSDEVYRLSSSDVETLHRFTTRTVLTVGTADSVKVYRGQIMELAIKHDFLMHVVLGLTLMHDRYLVPNRFPLPSQSESFHIFHGTAMFKQKLSGPICDDERDAMWGAAALLGCITHASINETDPEECWPLRPPTVADMDWIYMGEGKKVVWQLADPLREDSVWRDVFKTKSHENSPLPPALHIPDMTDLYPFISKLSDMEEPAPSPPKDPYQTAASILVRLLQLEVNHSTIMYFLSFMGHMDSRYRELLKEKDANALLLLVWWLAKMSTYPVWWASRRITLECQAICLYLERYHGDNADIMRLLTYPKTQCGLLDVGG